MLDRRVGLTGLHIVEDVVPVGERAPLGVLAGQADRDPFDEQGRKGERLGLAPVDPALLERLSATVELLRELRVNGEALGHSDELAVELV